METYAGSSDVGDGGHASVALLRTVEGVALDLQGNLYIADADDHRVRKVTPSGIIITVAGSGIPGFSGDGGRGDQARLDTPYGVAVDRSGNLYIADFHNSRVRKVSVDGRISTLAGGGSRQPGGDGDGGPASDVSLRAPRNIAIDKEGSIYFSDFEGHRVYRVGAYGILTTVAGGGIPGRRGDGGPGERAELSYPAGLAIDAAGALYIADSGNKLIRKVARGIISTLGSMSGPLVFGAPTGLSIDADNLYVADPQFRQVLKVSPAGAVTRVDSAVRDVASDPAGTLYIAASSEVRKQTPAGDSTVVAGISQQGNSGDPGLATAARLGRPAGLAFDGKGNLLIVDQVSGHVRTISPSGLISTLTSTLQSPRGVAADLYGNVFVSDAGSRTIRRFSGTGSSLVAGANDLTVPGPLATDDYGNLYASDPGIHRVVRISPSGRIQLLREAEKKAPRATEAWLRWRNSTRRKAWRSIGKAAFTSRIRATAASAGSLPMD